MFISRHTLKWTKTCRSSGDFPHAHTAHFLLNRHTVEQRRHSGLGPAGPCGAMSPAARHAICGRPLTVFWLATDQPRALRLEIPGCR